MAVLSVFIDESGDFGPYAPHSPYYVISLVFHNQDYSIAEPLAALHKHVLEAGFPANHAIHTAPLIRREEKYQYLDVTSRRKLFRALFTFVRQCNVSYKTFLINKKEVGTHDELVARLSRELGQFIRDNLTFFQSFERIVVYYDNGQKEITNIINAVFNAFMDAEIRQNIHPYDYSLFQAADMFCTLTFVKDKLKNNRLSKSEIAFFRNVRDLKKNYLKPIIRKRLM